MKDIDQKNFKNTKKNKLNKIESTLYTETEGMLYIVEMYKWEEINR